MGPRFLIATTRSGRRIHAIRRGKMRDKDVATLCGRAVDRVASVQEFISYDATNCRQCSELASREGE